MATYKIELHASTFPTGGGKHYFWILRDPSGKAIREMHGNNSDWVAGSSMPPGSLVFTENDLSKYPPSMPGLTSPYQLNRPEGAPKPKFESFQIYFESPNLDEALKRWNAAKALGEYLNTKKMEYQLFSTNSNAMANTLGLAMGFKPTRLSFEGPYLAPGLDIDLTREYGEGAPKSPYRIGKPIPLLKGGSLEDDGRQKFAALRDVELRTDILGRPSVATMTPAAARQAIEVAKADDAFSERYVGNDQGAVDYMHALHRAAYPDTDTVVGPSVRPDAGDSSAGRISSRRAIRRRRGRHSRQPSQTTASSSAISTGTGLPSRRCSH